MNQKLILYAFVLSAFAACTNKVAAPSETKEEPQTNSVQFSSAEAKISPLTIGTFTYRNISKTIQASGFLDVPPNSKVTIAAPMQGFVKTTSVLQGSRVAKGETIAVLQHQDYIQLQQDYLDYLGQLDYLEAENKRQQELSDEKVTATKTAQLAKSAYLSMLAKVKGSRAKLALIGIDVKTIANGELQQSINIKAPIAGYITQVNVNRGSFVGPADIMFVIVNTEHLHAELTIFEKDIANIKPEQKVLFTLANESKQRSAHVHLIGREIKADRSVQIHCHLDEEDGQLIPGTFLTAHIETKTEKVTAVPESAIISYEGKEYLFIQKQPETFEMIAITKGNTEDAFVAIVVPKQITESSKIVLSGGHYLLGKMKNIAEE